MSTASPTTPRRSFSLFALLTLLSGLLLTGYGLLVSSVSLLGGAWLAAAGLSVLLAGLFLNEWMSERYDIPSQQRRTLAVAFLIVAVLLLVSFVVVNFATFTAVDAGPSSQ